VRHFSIFLATICLGQDVGSLHIFQGDVPFSSKLNLQLHGRFRTRVDLSEYMQSRGGGIVSYRVNPRVGLMGGYYFIDEADRTGKLNNFHRGFGGVQLFAPAMGIVNLESRTVLEQFFATPTGSYLRARQRVSVSLGKRVWRPYIQTEGLVQRGILTGRFGSGVQYVGRPGQSVSMGYEMRQSPNGTYMHLLTTVFQVQLRN